MESLNNKNNINLLIGLTGSVASIKYLDLITLFVNSENPKFNIKIIATNKSCNFLNQEFLKEKCINLKDNNISIPILTDDAEWFSWEKKGDPILHIDLRKWTDIFLIAPLSANTMAKIVNGLCDNLITSTLRAWNFLPTNNNINILDYEFKLLEKPIIVAPAMNTFMYENPITEKQIKKMKKMNIIVLNTVKKKLACGDEGFGAMEEVSKIFDYIIQIYNEIYKS